MIVRSFISVNLNVDGYINANAAEPSIESSTARNVVTIIKEHKGKKTSIVMFSLTVKCT